MSSNQQHETRDFSDPGSSKKSNSETEETEATTAALFNFDDAPLGSNLILVRIIQRNNIV